MSKYLRAILIFFFFYVFVGQVVSNFLADLAATVGIENGGWAGMVGGFMGALLGLILAMRRVKTNISWRMTPLRIALIIGCFHFALQQFWLTLLFALGETSHGAPASTTHMLTVIDDIIRFPSLFLRLEDWTLLLSSTFWVLVSYCVFVLINRMRVRKSRMAADSSKNV
jgi:hypothetical protein